MLRKRSRRFVVPLLVLALVTGVGLLIRSTLPGLHPDPKTTATSGVTTSSNASPAKGAAKGDKSKVTAGLVDAVGDRTEELTDLAQAAEAQNKLLQSRPPVATLKVATFNVLGDSHTRSGGKNARLADGARRMQGTLGLIRGHGIDVVALQELQRSQVATFLGSAGEYGLYPGAGASGWEGQNSIAWREADFELVDGGMRAYPYFGGKLRNFPQVLLRHKLSGVQFYVTSYHNPADMGKKNAGNRARAKSMQIANVNSLLGTEKRPVIIAGDMNEKAEYFCPMVQNTPMRAANGGSADGGCRPPSGMRIDWLMGSPKVRFSSYVDDRTPTFKGISDHGLIVATARVTGLPQDRLDAAAQ